MRGNAIAHFSSKYGPFPSGDFWQSCFANSTPMQWINEQTLNDLINTYGQLTLMHRYGVTQTKISYSELKTMMLTENQKRSSTDFLDAMTFTMQAIQVPAQRLAITRL